jgi:hypothetical protein
VTAGSGVSSISPSLTATTTYYAEARIPGTQCVSAGRLAVTGTINPIPAKPTAPSANSRCGAGEVTFSATVPSDATINWYDASSAGNLVSGGGSVTYISPSLTATTTYYAAALIPTTGCTSPSRTAVMGTVYEPPAPPTGASANRRCGSGTVTFSANPGYGCTIDWYDAMTGGNLVTAGSGVSSISPSLTATTTYYAEARIPATQCVSASRLAVPGSVTAMPEITSHPTATTICPGVPAQLIVVAPGATSYQWLKNGTSTTEGTGYTSATYTTSALSANGTYAVVVHYQAPCSTTSAPAPVSVKVLTLESTLVNKNACRGIPFAVRATNYPTAGYTWTVGTNVPTPAPPTLFGHIANTETPVRLYVALPLGSCSVTFTYELIDEATCSYADRYAVSDATVGLTCYNACLASGKGHVPSWFEGCAITSKYTYYNKIYIDDGTKQYQCVTWDGETFSVQGTGKNIQNCKKCMCVLN